MNHPTPWPHARRALFSPSKCPAEVLANVLLRQTSIDKQTPVAAGRPEPTEDQPHHPCGGAGSHLQAGT